MSKKLNSGPLKSRSKPLGRRLLRNGIVGAGTGFVCFFASLLALSISDSRACHSFLRHIYRFVTYPSMLAGDYLVRVNLITHENIIAAMILVLLNYIAAGLAIGMILTLIGQGLRRRAR